MQQPPCLFCDFYSKKDKLLFESEHFFARADEFPVNNGHTLLLPQRHCADTFSLTTEEWADLFSLLRQTKEYLDNEFHPDGYNIGINNGEAAGQTIFHLHIHVIPRYAGDVENPRGGIRNFKKPLREY